MSAHEILLGNAVLTGEIAVAQSAPAQVVVEAGRPVLFKFGYHFQDMPAIREEYQFALTVQVDDEPAETERLGGDDHPAVNDDVRGFITQERRFLAPGEHTVRFTAAVTLEVGDWQGPEAQLNRQELAGVLRVTVR